MNFSNGKLRIARGHKAIEQGEPFTAFYSVHLTLRRKRVLGDGDLR